MTVVQFLNKIRLWVKKLLPHSLYGRALMIIVSPLILLQLITGWIFYDRHWDTITWRLASALAGDIQHVMWEIKDRPEHLKEIFKRAEMNLELKFVLHPNEILPNDKIDGSGLIDRLLAKALTERVRRPFLIDSSSFKEQVVIDFQLADAVLTVVAPGKRLFSSTTYIFIIWMIGTSMILFAVASIFMRNQVRPIRRLADAVDSFGKGRDPGKDFKPGGASEVRLAANAFNRMMQRIRRQIRQRTDMLSGVSHDLKTPLTRMKLQLALMDEGPDSEALKSNLSEMERMIEGYLTFAKGEGGEPSRPHDITEMLNDMSNTWRSGGIMIDCHVEGALVMEAKPQALRRCIDNLLSNANRYADTIWLSAGIRGAGIQGNVLEIVVDDDGPGIPEEERENVFRPFYRVDESRNAKTGGTGLGLSLSRDVARAHGGEIYLEDSPYGGLRARVRLPL